MSAAGDVNPKRHPLLADFLLQYPSCDEDAADRAFLVYQDLTEVKVWWYTELAYNSQLERPYVIGQRSRYVLRQAVLPVAVEETITLHEIRQFFSSILVDEEPIESLFLAVSELDSTVVYYKLTSGLSPPEAVELTAAKQQEKDARIAKKRQHVAACVRKALERFNPT